LNKGTGYRNGLSTEERGHRLGRYWYGYWGGVKKMLADWKADTAKNPALVNPKIRYVFSMHSYTACYEGEIRELQIGVLCTHYEDLARYIEQGFKKAGYNAEINQPYNSCNGAN
jgi:predicted N-formylglutamate amidohydrolase